MNNSIFISVVYEDIHRMESIKKWADHKRLGDVTIASETQDKRIQGPAAIKEHIKNKIKGAKGVLVLIGQDTHNHDWIVVEAELANSFQVPILCIRIPGTTGGFPKILEKYEPMNFDPDSLKKALDSI